MSRPCRCCVLEGCPALDQVKLMLRSVVGAGISRNGLEAQRVLDLAAHFTASCLLRGMRVGSLVVATHTSDIRLLMLAGTASCRAVWSLSPMSFQCTKFCSLTCSLRLAARLNEWTPCASNED